MTIVPVHSLDQNDLQILGNNTAEAIRLDHEELQALTHCEPEHAVYECEN